MNDLAAPFLGTSAWIDAPEDPRPPLAGDARADVAIVGGGLTGLSTAIALRDAGVDVALVERAFCGAGASGRNAGHLTPTIGKDMPTLRALMQEHRRILQPKFDAVLKALDEGLGNKTVNGAALGSWTRPQGGYFILFDTQPGLADKVVKLTAGAGVKLTPAGSTYPYRKDPNDTNIRLAPSFPSVAEIEAAMRVFVLCVELATLEKALAL